ncbi:MAG: BatD family protein [Vicinamibacteria bacterium]|nr:BatD family protein [Vicinamibacteria bacterium]
MATDDATLGVNVDERRIGLDDQLRLTISLQGRNIDLEEEIAAPPLKNLRVAGGPFVSSQFSIVNGSISQGKTYTYILRPTAPGSAEVGSVRARLRSGERASAPIAIEIVEGSVRPPQSQRGGDPFGRGLGDPFGEDPFEELMNRRRGAEARTAAPRMYIEAAVSRTQLSIGEPLLLTYWLYTQVPVSDLQFAEMPRYAGFWVEDLERAPSAAQGEVVAVGNDRFQRFPMMQKLLFPTKAGQLSLPAVTFRVTIPQQSFFDPGPTRVDRATKPITVTVSALPTETGFTGAVGTLRATATLDKNRLTIGEAATLCFRVEGSGNLKWIEPGLEVKVNGAKVFPPQVKSDIAVSAAGMTGARTWDYVIVPETSGTIEIPALSFAYFDPKAGRIVRTSTAPMRLESQMASGPAMSAAPAVSVSAAPGGGLALRSDLDLQRLPSLALGARLLIVLLGAGLLLHGVIFVLPHLAQWRWRGASSGVGRVSSKSALADVARAARGGMSKEAAAGLIEKALLDVCGALDEGAAADPKLDVARAVLDEVRFIRYAPQLGDYSEKIREVAERAAEAIRRRA